MNFYICNKLNFFIFLIVSLFSVVLLQRTSFQTQMVCKSLNECSNSLTIPFSTRINQSCQCLFQHDINLLKYDFQAKTENISCRCTQDKHCPFSNSQCVFKKLKNIQNQVFGFCQCVHGYLFNRSTNECSALPVLSKKDTAFNCLLQGSIFVVFPLLSWAALFCLCLRIRKKLPIDGNVEHQENVDVGGIEIIASVRGVKCIPETLEKTDLPPPYSVVVTQTDTNQHVIVNFK